MCGFSQAAESASENVGMGSAAELRKRGLSYQGLKNALVARLRDEEVHCDLVVTCLVWLPGWLVVPRSISILGLVQGDWWVSQG